MELIPYLTTAVCFAWVIWGPMSNRRAEETPGAGKMVRGHVLQSPQ